MSKNRLNMRMRATLKDEISALTAEKEPSPIEYIERNCSVLLRLLSDATGIEDSEKLARELFYRVYEKEQGCAAVRAVADLLVLQEMSTEEKRQLFEKYDKKDKPLTFTPHGIEVRKIVAARHLGYTITYSDKKKPEWVTNFVDALCDELISEYPSAFLPLVSEASATSRLPSADPMTREPDAHKETSRPTIRSRIARRFKRE
ncbi:hypothetical protein ACE6JH_04895 [Streptomyces nigra]